VTTSVQRAIGRGVLLIGRLLGVGGREWDVLTPDGDGITTSRTYTLLATWNGSVLDGRPTQEASAATGAPGPGSQQWEAVSDGATPDPGAVIRSVANPLIAFEVIASDVTAGYRRAILRPIAPPPVPTPAVVLDLGTDDGVALALGMDVL
jgi:hypothetical protein